MKAFKLVTGVSLGLLLQAQAFAGFNADGTVHVGSNYAYGGLHDARNNPGNSEEITCSVEVTLATASATSTQNYVYCYAQDTSGNYYYCYSNTPPQTWITMLSGVNETTWLDFSGDSSHHCLDILTDQGSEDL